MPRYSLDVEISQTVVHPSQPPRRLTIYFHLLSRKLGLDAGSSALSLPEMLFRTWGRKMNREASEPRGRVRGRLVQNESTFQSDLSRLKTLTPARARRSGGRKTSIFWVLVLKQGGREIGIS